MAGKKKGGPKGAPRVLLKGNSDDQALKDLGYSSTSSRGLVFVRFKHRTAGYYNTIPRGAQIVEAEYQDSSPTSRNKTHRIKLIVLGDEVLGRLISLAKFRDSEPEDREYSYSLKEDGPQKKFHYKAEDYTKETLEPHPEAAIPKKTNPLLLLGKPDDIPLKTLGYKSRSVFVKFDNRLEGYYPSIPKEARVVKATFIPSSTRGQQVFGAELVIIEGVKGKQDQIIGRIIQRNNFQQLEPDKRVYSYRLKKGGPLKKFYFEAERYSNMQCKVLKRTEDSLDKSQNTPLEDYGIQTTGRQIEVRNQCYLPFSDPQQRLGGIPKNTKLIEARYKNKHEKSYRSIQLVCDKKNNDKIIGSIVLRDKAASEKRVQYRKYEYGEGFKNKFIFRAEEHREIDLPPPPPKKSRDKSASVTAKRIKQKKITTAQLSQGTVVTALPTASLNIQPEACATFSAVPFSPAPTILFSEIPGTPTTPLPPLSPFDSINPENLLPSLSQEQRLPQEQRGKKNKRKQSASSSNTPVVSTCSSLVNKKIKVSSMTTKTESDLQDEAHAISSSPMTPSSMDTLDLSSILALPNSMLSSPFTIALPQEEESCLPPIDDKIEDRQTETTVSGLPEQGLSTAENRYRFSCLSPTQQLIEKEVPSSKPYHF